MYLVSNHRYLPNVIYTKHGIHSSYRIPIRFLYPRNNINNIFTNMQMQPSTLKACSREPSDAPCKRRPAVEFKTQPLSERRYLRQSAPRRAAPAAAPWPPTARPARPWPPSFVFSRTPFYSHNRTHTPLQCYERLRQIARLDLRVMLKWISIYFCLLSTLNYTRYNDWNLISLCTTVNESVRI